ncbi:hypothetical protein [Helicobacter japonicus]|uniref:Uncharacterized protein n=2 Tax=Helicobacter japonicus TaxID=425400 RepID=A0A4U8TL78_9HELI|nr:hypothetical protein [Helicobacter japonicus]TLE01230.1 hypothetical protein LS65_006350 [Helicobacter japonicus]
MFSYTDPLVGIIILVAIIALVTFIDYYRNRYKDKQKEKSLKNLTKSYEFVGLTQGVEEFLALSDNPIPTLQFIANAYIQSGNTQEAIKIYLSILEKLQHSPESSKAKIKIEILQNLGNAYYSAGFLQRAKNVYLEILKNYPRNPQVLIYLLKTYEYLNEYKNAIDALMCIEEIYENMPPSKNEHFFYALELNKAYLHTLLLINSHDMPIAEKIIKLNEIKDNEPKLEKIVLSFFKSVNHSLFWEEMIKSKHQEKYIDILWQFDDKDVPLEQLTDKQILDVYRAKGLVVDNQSCEIFELENMRILKRYSNVPVDLDFEYRCHGCKQIFPFENARCSHCGELLNSDVLLKIRKIDNEASYPLL